MGTPELTPTLPKRRLLLVIEVCWVGYRMVEERPRFEVVLGTVVSSPKDDRQRPSDALAIGTLNASRLFIDKNAFLVVPSTNLISKAANSLLGQIRENRADSNECWCPLSIEVVSGKEIVLIDRRATKETLWAQHEV